MSNFTSNYLGILKKTGRFDEITDGTVKINTIAISENPEIFSYSRPKIVYDKFSKEQELLVPDIKKIYDSLVAVRELGFEIISMNVVKGWFKKQNAQYKIRKASLISDSASVLNQIPARHYIEFDRANKRVRLVGRNCRNSHTGTIGSTEWEAI